MTRVFWTWHPVCAGTCRDLDEPHVREKSKWFFDKSVWQKMFRTMSGCGFDAMVLASTHPFRFLIDTGNHFGTRATHVPEASEFRRMHEWIFATARDYEISPYLMLFGIHLPRPPIDCAEPPSSVLRDLSVEYTHHCVRRALEEYPDLAGLFADASGDIIERRTEFLQQAVVDALDAARPDAVLFVSVCPSEPGSCVSGLRRRGSKRILYSVEYTFEHLVDGNPDPAFSRWVAEAGAENVAAEVWASNVEPWTAFSYESAEGIVSNLSDLGCAGFSLHPLAPCDWPHCSDESFKYQWQRDLVWYSVWGGATVEEMISRGQPKWVVRNRRLIEGFESGSRILELLALYFAGNKRNQWRPQFCWIGGPSGAHLVSIEDMLHLPEHPGFTGLNWWQEVTGDTVVHLAQYLESGTPAGAYGPEELMDELADLAASAVAAGEKGMRNASGEKELPSLARDAFCMGRLGEFYVERLRAALAHARGSNIEALEHMSRAIGIYKEIRAVDSAHRGAFSVLAGESVISGSWMDTIRALESEYQDAQAGHFGRGENYLVCQMDVAP